LDLFPVLAEYAEFLVSEGAYKEVLDILPASQDECGFSDAEWSLVRLLESLSNLQLGDAPELPLKMACDWYLDKTADDPHEISEIDVGCFISLKNESLLTPKSFNAWKFTLLLWYRLEREGSRSRHMPMSFHQNLCRGF
jgi:hypothetical protein